MNDTVWTVTSGRLPEGLALSCSTGLISGIPKIGWDTYSHSGYPLGKSKKGLKKFQKRFAEGRSHGLRLRGYSFTIRVTDGNDSSEVQDYNLW